MGAPEKDTGETGAYPDRTRSRASITRATLLVALSSAGFGSISTLTLIVTRSGTPLIPAMFWRYLTAAAVMAIVLLLARPAWSNDGAQRNRMLLLLTLGGLGQALVTYLSLRALDYIPVGPLAFLFYTYPAWVTLIAAARRVDRITRRRAIALTLALAGVTAIVGLPTSEGGLDPTGVALALASAITYGFYLPGVSAAQRGMNPMLSATLIIAGATVVFGVVAAGEGTLWTPVPPRAAAGIGALALISTAGAFWTLLAGLAVLGPVRTAIVATIEPFYTTLLGFIVFGDALTRRTLVGGALIAAAVILIQRSSGASAAPRSPDSADRSV